MSWFWIETHSEYDKSVGQQRYAIMKQSGFPRGSNEKRA